MTPRAAYTHVADSWDPAGTPTDVNADAILDSAITVAETALDLADNKGHPDRHTHLYDTHSRAVARLQQLVVLTGQVEAAQEGQVV